MPPPGSTSTGPISRRAGERAVVLRQSFGPSGPAKRIGRDRYADLAERMYWWLHSRSASLHELAIMRLLTTLAPPEVTKVEWAYSQPRGGTGEWTPYRFRRDITAMLPNGTTIARWIEAHSELPPRAGAAESRKTQDAEKKQVAEGIWPTDRRQDARRGLRDRSKWPSQAPGRSGGFIVTGGHYGDEIERWGSYVIDNFELLCDRSVVTGQMKDLLRKPYGYLGMIWEVRTDLWNRYLRINAESVQPTALHKPTAPVERRGAVVAAATAIPKLEAFRKEWFAGRFDWMDALITARVQQLSDVIERHDPDGKLRKEAGVR